MVRSGIVQAPQSREVFASISVRDNLDLGAATIADRTAIRAALREVLERSLSRRAGSLSGGQQQQLSVARALMSRPRMLLMDEPSAGLARNSLAPNIVRLVETNRQLHVRGMTILLVEQNGGVAAAVAEIAYVLRFGVIAHSGPAAELISNAELLASYLGR